MRPSAPQVGRSAPIRPVATRRRLAGALEIREHDARGATTEPSPSVSRNATRRPSPLTAGRCGLQRAERHLRRRAVADRNAPQLELAAALAREHDGFAVGRERRVEVDVRVVREAADVAALEQPNIAERREHRAPAVGRRREARDPVRDLRREVVELRQIGGRRPRLDAARREQMHGAARLRRDAAAPELPVGGIHELGGREPKRAERGRCPPAPLSDFCTSGSPSTSICSTLPAEPVAFAEHQHAAAGTPARGR